MKKLVLAMFLWNGILFGQNTLYDGFFSPEAMERRTENKITRTYQEKLDEHKLIISEKIKSYVIEYIIELAPNGDGFFVDDYLIAAGILKDGAVKNICNTKYSCVDCPDDDTAWLDEMRYREWHCPKYGLNICDIIQCKNRDRETTTTLWKDHTFDGGK